MLWGGRFKDSFDQEALKFSSSLNIDINLVDEDIEGSTVHTEMLGKIKILSREEVQSITSGLAQIKDEWEKDNWVPDPEKFEDIHSAIESRLFELIGNTAGKLHTGRSRNDQIATDIYLWIKKAIKILDEQIKKFQLILVDIASGHINTIIPGFTHLQRAQPISLAFHLLAYVEMMQRDRDRISSLKSLICQSPLGAGALAGSTIPLDRHFTSSKLGFKEPTRNALDTVSNRDFLLDFLNNGVICMMHLSRLSEEIIMWSTSEWNFIKLNDKYTTGSSLMPQKKNPDLAELIRGKSGRVYGNYIALATTMKSLPLSYNRDLQEDKEPLFDTYFTLLYSIEMMGEMLKTAKFNKLRFSDELKGDFSLATDLADWLVLKGVSFREAHHIVGEVVKKLEDENKNFADVKLELLKEINTIFDEDALKCLNVETSLKRKLSYGSPNPKMVEDTINYWKGELK